MLGLRVWWLSRRLRSRKYSIREAAARSLGRLADARAIATLLDFLKDREYDALHAASTALVNLKPVSLPVLIALVQDNQQPIRFRSLVADVLERMPDASAAAPLLSAFRWAQDRLRQGGDEYTRLKNTAAIAFTACARADANAVLRAVGAGCAVVPLLTAFLWAETSTDRTGSALKEAVFDILVACARADADAVVAALSNPGAPDHVLIACAEGTRDPRFVPLLRKRGFVDVLASMGSDVARDAAVELLIEKLRTGDPDRSDAALRTCELFIHDPRLMPPLAELLTIEPAEGSNPHAYVDQAQKAAAALLAQDDARAVPIILAAAEQAHEDAVKRAALLWTAAGRGHEAAQKALREAACRGQLPDGDIAEVAKKFGDVRAVGLLLRLARKRPHAQAAVDALERILSVDAQAVTVGDLAVMAALETAWQEGPSHGWDEHDGWRQEPDREVNCTRLRQLAQAELARRHVPLPARKARR